ncbi:MAG: hypothetical protein L0Y72_10360 [Gemmataceae bacterium]|nr:hypothetical protein [Gemmataceae bacterium]MCI0739436.1 hypothetical protein [Gemmataceae bacterium]
MKMEIQPELAERKPLAEIVKDVTPLLEDAIGPAAARVTATWAFQADENGRPLIRLTLADQLSGTGTRDFSPEELQSRDRAWWRLSRFWGDILQAASERLLRSLEAVGADEQGS